MKLAKNCIDVGLFTNNGEAMLRFWQDEVGLPFEEMLAVGGCIRQQRHAMNGSVFKLNDARDPLPNESAAGYRELLIARESLSEPRSLIDPDGNRVTLVPAGHKGVTGIGVRLAVRDASAFRDFMGDSWGSRRSAKIATDGAIAWSCSTKTRRHNGPARCAQPGSVT